MATAAAIKPIVSQNTLSSILKIFPSQVSYCFAYGSAVFPQSLQKPGKMIDLVFVVENPQEWHSENLKFNSSHYSGIKYFGSAAITKIQENMACGVYYNPYVRVQDQLIKYGVISRKAFERDLLEWSHLYVAGRLHKPVYDLKPPTSSHLVKCIKKNRESALRIVLLQENRHISKFNLYHGIAELSYIGDSRMKIAENPDKTVNIVTPLINEFDRIYYPLLESLEPHVEINRDGFIIQENSPKIRFKHLMALPSIVQINLAKRIKRDPRLIDIEESMAELSYMPNPREIIRQAVADIIWTSSIMQTVQGFISAGVTRSVKYALEKLKKRASVGKSKSTPLLSSESEQETLKRSNPFSKDGT